jgi:hypothetical protein
MKFSKESDWLVDFTIVTYYSPQQSTMIYIIITNWVLSATTFANQLDTQ